MTGRARGLVLAALTGLLLAGCGGGGGSSSGGGGGGGGGGGSGGADAPSAPALGNAYLFRRYANRATGENLARVFVHCVWRKPTTAHPSSAAFESSS